MMKEAAISLKEGGRDEGEKALKTATGRHERKAGGGRKTESNIFVAALIAAIMLKAGGERHMVIMSRRINRLLM
jgi:hypothetical protein